MIRFLACILALVLAACERPLERADLVIINGSEPDSIDPPKIRGQPEGRIAYGLYEGLTRFNEKGRAEPGCAEKWEISPDGKKYTFHLREGLQWSNGDPVTSQDFLWSWFRAMRDPDCDYAYQFFYIRGAEAYSTAEASKRPAESTVGVTAPDARTVVVELNNPTPFFLDLCAFYTFMPVHRASIEAAQQKGEFWMRPGKLVSNGAFTMVMWRLNDRIRLQKNPKYWDAANVRNNTVDVLPVPSPNTAFNLYASGVADLMMDKSLVPTSLIDELKKRPDYHSAPIMGTYFFRFNVTRKPWNDVRVRQAFALVINKSRLTEKVTKAGEPPTNSFVPPGTAGYQPPEGIQRDTDRARKLLAEAGYPGGAGFPVVHYLYTNRSDTDEKIGVELQDMIKKELGISIQLAKQEWAVYLNSLSSLDFDFARSSWVGDYLDPNTFLDMFMTGGGNNNTGWSNAKYDELIRSASQQTDQGKRFEIFREAENMILNEHTIIVPLYNYVVVMFYKDNLGGISGNLTDEHPFRAMYWKDKK